MTDQDLGVGAERKRSGKETRENVLPREAAQQGGDVDRGRLRAAVEKGQGVSDRLQLPTAVRVGRLQLAQRMQRQPRSRGASLEQPVDAPVKERVQACRSHVNVAHEVVRGVEQ